MSDRRTRPRLRPAGADARRTGLAGEARGADRESTAEDSRPHHPSAWARGGRSPATVGAPTHEIELDRRGRFGTNHSLSLGPYWGSETGGFYATSELTGDLYARWLQFSAFTPSFRSHGRI